MLTLLLVCAVAADIPPEISDYLKREHENRIKDATRLNQEIVTALRKRNSGKINGKMYGKIKARCTEELADIMNQKYLTHLTIPLSDRKIGYTAKAQVMQVVNANEMLARYGDTYCLLRGVSSQGIADDDWINLKIMMKVSGTYSYADTSGGKRTVMVLVPFDIKEIDQWRDQWKAANGATFVKENPKDKKAK